MSTLRLFTVVCALFASLLLCGARANTPEADATLSLAGDWDFALGAPEPAFPQAAAAPAIHFTDTIALPGTTETRGKGPLNPGRDLGSLTRLHRFDGPAWYRRDFTIPADWAGRRVVLELERTKYTQVWLDGRPLGAGTVHTAPQHFDLSDLATPGRHSLLILVDNRPARRPVQGEAHQFSDNTQTNWNGLLGRLRLVSTPRVWIDSLEVHPQFPANGFLVKGVLRNRTGAPVSVDLSIDAPRLLPDGPSAPGPSSTVETRVFDALETPFALSVSAGPDARLWDEYSPALYGLRVSARSPVGIHTLTTKAGLRDFRAADGRFLNNGRVVFLRGKHDGCVFPLTGHPPMEVEGWRAYFSTLRSYGINHVRCHTWVPPEAAFEAADELGIFLQPELPFWGTFNAAVRDFLAPEAEATLRAYGNHPSFVMFTLGNEIGGDRTLMNAMVTDLRNRDPRRLYADGSNNVLWDPRLQPSNDFWSSAKAINPASNNRQIPARGSFCVFDGNEGHVQWGPAETRTDLSAAIAGIMVPFVGHETGQWTVYPDYSEIARYTGVTRARNLETFRDTLARRGLAGQAADFHRASAALALALYKEENELFLRTPRMSGFQLLDLQDFPGQGTALVGVLDAFMTPKAGVTPELWRRSCDDLVALARFDRYTWTTDEIYLADLELAHYGRADLAGAVLSWELRAADGTVLASQTLPARDLPRGGLRPLGRVEAALSSVRAPARLDLRVSLLCPSEGGRVVRNDWPVWVYPSDKSLPRPPEGVHLARAFDAETRRRLADGGRVVLVPGSRNWADTLPGAYATDFWNWPMFNGTPGTMGLLIQASHPALAAFPSSFHSERQWSAIAHASTPVLLTTLQTLPASGGAATAPLAPLVQVIDNLERNERLGLVFEVRVGPGSLLVCAADLVALSAAPEARQLLRSLLDYAASPAFAPARSAEPAALARILSPNVARDRGISASSFLQPPWGAVPSPARAVDGDLNTRWIAAAGDESPVLTLDLGGIHTVDTLRLTWEADEPGYAWRAEWSADGASWRPLCDSSSAEGAAGGRHLAGFPPVQAAHLRLTCTARPAGRGYCLRELQLQ